MCDDAWDKRLKGRKRERVDQDIKTTVNDYVNKVFTFLYADFNVILQLSRSQSALLSLLKMD